jgi:transcriptional regulator GlxA family with amidase domain
MDKKREREMITQTMLLERPGWSRKLVEKLLGEPDVRKKVYGYGKKLCLYSMDRILAAESSREFADQQESLAKRQIAAQKAVETKQQNLLEAVKAMEITVERIDRKQLKKLAVDAYNERNLFTDRFADLDSSKDFLDRICVNYVRHNLTEYDAALEEIAGKVGNQEALILIRLKVYTAIAEAYPELAAECNRQLDERLMEMLC